MANTLSPFLRNAYLSFQHLVKFNSYLRVAVGSQRTRNLYAPTTLGIDGFLHTKEKVKHQMSNILHKFKEKMTEYSQEESKNMIFTEDLKNMIHISENDEDINLVVRMMKRYNQQNKSLRFGNYVFGPVVMRMLYIHNKPDVAFECFKSPELSGFFEQLMTYQLLLDLLYENQKYNEVLEATNIIKERQIEGTKYPKNIVVLALAACYKLNTKESLDYALKLWGELRDVGHFPMRRATTFCAGLALNQGQPETAMEILTFARNQNYTTIRNLKVAALADLGRVEDAIPILKGILNEDMPQGNVHTFNKDVIERVKTAVDKSENPELTLEFNRLFQIFQKQGNLSDTVLDEQLCAEIQKPPQMNNRQQNQFQPRDFQQRQPRNYEDRSNRPYKSYNPPTQRPGLSDLV